MTKIFIKIALFIIPYFAVSMAAAFLPLNFFTFRVWEGMLVYKRSPLLPGPFYPNRKIAMIEEGDLGHGTPYAIKKPVRWETDRYGYRTADTEGYPEIVVIGDSNIVGSSLSQEHIFSEVLQRKLQRSVYPYAPGDFNNFLRDPRFSLHPPKVVIFEQLERDILHSTPLRVLKPKHANRWAENPLLSWVAVVVDRMLKCEPVNFLKARITPKTLGMRYNNIFFFQGDGAVKDADPKEIGKTVAVLDQYRDYLKKRKIQFIYLPIPNKETIYFDCLPSGRRSTVLQQVLAELGRTEVAMIDLLKAYEKKRQMGVMPYQRDDTHWNEVGVDIAAQLVAERIREQLLPDNSAAVSGNVTSAE